MLKGLFGRKGGGILVTVLQHINYVCARFDPPHILALIYLGPGKFWVFLGGGGPGGGSPRENFGDLKTCSINQNSIPAPKIIKI